MLTIVLFFGLGFYFTSIKIISDHFIFDYIHSFLNLLKKNKREQIVAKEVSLHQDNKAKHKLTNRKCKSVNEQETKHRIK